MLLLSVGLSLFFLILRDSDDRACLLRGFTLGYQGCSAFARNLLLSNHCKNGVHIIIRRTRRPPTFEFFVFLQEINRLVQTITVSRSSGAVVRRYATTLEAYLAFVRHRCGMYLHSCDYIAKLLDLRYATLESYLVFVRHRCGMYLHSRDYVVQLLDLRRVLRVNMLAFLRKFLYVQPSDGKCEVITVRLA